MRPRSSPGRGRHIERYARVLRCAEINSSFHRSHRPAIYERWAAQTPADFRFSVKLPRAITHEGRLRNARAPLRAFFAEAAGLGDRLAVVLVQLPPSFSFEAAPARRFFAVLGELFAGAVVCEPRHASWFTASADRVLVALRVGRVAADPARWPAPLARAAGSGRPATAPVPSCTTAGTARRACTGRATRRRGCAIAPPRCSAGRSRPNLVHLRQHGERRRHRQRARAAAPARGAESAAPSGTRDRDRSRRSDRPSLSAPAAAACGSRGYCAFFTPRRRVPPTDLPRMKLIALALLCAAAVVYVVAALLHGAHPGVGLRRRLRRGGDGGRDRRLVRGGRAVPPSARAADPAHRDHPDATRTASARTWRPSSAPTSSAPSRCWPSCASSTRPRAWPRGWPSRATPKRWPSICPPRSPTRSACSTTSGCARFSVRPSSRASSRSTCRVWPGSCSAR